MKHEVMVLISVLWIALSIPVGLAVGQFINAVMKGRHWVADMHDHLSPNSF
jgi:hypothetical protein